MAVRNVFVFAAGLNGGARALLLVQPRDAARLAPAPARSKESGGAAVGVSDEEVLAVQKRLGRGEGIGVEPASAAAVATLSSLIARGEIDPGGRIVCILSGAGFKDAHLAEEEAAAVFKREPAPFEAGAIAALAALSRPHG